MIPSVVVQQLQQGVKDFLRTTFPSSTPFFSGALESLLEEEGAVFKGPYLSLQLPFRQGAGGSDFFPQVPLKFRPYLHQEKAFQRLSGPQPQSTIIATGTGSGKTECFLYPILEYCRAHSGEDGIKALLIYPMNALATDQAGRIAKTIWNNPHLKGRVTAGLFIGQHIQNPQKTMGPTGIVTDRDTMHLKPPDILLTNYKMLDYLLIRPKDAPLWQYNGPETLRFLVVDELHTFDGAQGTDLACLLRRLKARLNTPRGHLCCVGTSATLGDRKDQDTLIGFSQEVFAETFDTESIINESTVTAAEFIGDSPIEYVDVPSRSDAHVLDPEQSSSYPDYLRTQHAMWFLEDIPEEDWEKNRWRIELGNRLKSSMFFRNLLTSLNSATRGYEDILDDLVRWSPELSIMDAPTRRQLLTSFLALISEARAARSAPQENDSLAPGLDEGDTGPFLNVRIQLWLRELRRMVSEVGNPPRIRFADDLTEEQRKTHLPMVHCRDCGAMGWTGLRPHDTFVDPNLTSFYKAFFKNSPKVVFLFPLHDHETSSLTDAEPFDLCTSCLHLVEIPKGDHPKRCPSCGNENLIRVLLPVSTELKDSKVVGVHHCPFCQGRNSLTLLGSQAASLTSVLVGQLYASNFNSDKKLLTFSDSVQDAAHRAGFMAARTYRFNFRTALQTFVQEQGRGMNLGEFPGAFCEYWMERLGPSAFVATFLPPALDWLADYDHLKTYGTVPDGSMLLADVKSRVGWELFSEYGLYSRIGRTLEKTGSSIVHPSVERLDGLMPQLREILSNEIGGFRDLPEPILRTFVLGVLLRMRHRGGIIHPVLGTYIGSKGKNTYVTKKLNPWMPGFAGGARAPVFLTDAGGERFDQVSSAAFAKKNWTRDWIERCFAWINPLIKSDPWPCIDYTIKTLVQGKVLQAVPVTHGKVWGIEPEALVVSNEVVHCRCGACGAEISAPRAEEKYWTGAPCLRFNCTGTYSRIPGDQEYYAKLYTTGDVSRIFPAEHTGLLTRGKREDVEFQFKASEQERQPWYPNLLSCTPTLEMGIDIGDLSSVILCSVPPSQANYIQRVGRSGRTDGNAANVTVVNARPHDLFFFAQPMDMIAGSVETPGVFLSAPAVLERQFTAYCFDRWVASGISESAIPSQLGQVLNNLSPTDGSRFPHTFIQFIDKHQKDLRHGFVQLFEGSLDEGSQKELDIFIKGDQNTEGSLPWKILDGLHSRSRERESLKNKVKILGRRIKKKMDDPAKGQDYEKIINELNREKEGLQEILKNIKNQNTFNFFTDEGLIPNYAFPESGVTLRSIIYRKKTDAAAKGPKYQTFTEQYQRAAVSAIHELAPGSTFYAGGRKVKVDQVDMSLSQPQVWRLCDKCSYSELSTADPVTGTCPRCGSDAWPDVGRKRTMLRISQVFATSSDDRSRISDDSDEREPSFFNKHMLVDFEDSAIKRAYCIDTPEVAFGFDFISSASFREVNFGEDDPQLDSFQIAGRQVATKGFVVCKKCGKVQAGSKDIQHSWTCTARDQDSDANLVDCIHLFREFSTEAIRILLPVGTFSGSERKLQSFIAALQLGLKTFFKGRIDHLQTTLHEEPEPESDHRRKYLIVYDTVPGGTGYLKQLMVSEKPLMDVLRGAFDVLSSCTCQNDPAKDGCYKCLLAYRTSFRMAETSRKTAIELLGRILDQEDKIRVTDSLRSVPIDAILDSELEALFLESLRTLNREDMTVTLTKELVNNKPGYLLSLKQHTPGTEQLYYIEPQVLLGWEDNIAMNSKADFVVRSAYSRDAALTPIALFLDGYEYHKAHISRDMAQRMAIVKSGRFLTWSLTWADVERTIQKKPQDFVNFIDPSSTPGGAKLREILTSQRLDTFDKHHTLSSVEWFIRLLMNPEDLHSWSRYANMVGLTCIAFNGHDKTRELDQWRRDLRESLPPSLFRLFETARGPFVWGSHVPGNESFPGSVRLYGLRQKTGPGNSVPELLLACILHDREENVSQKNFIPVWNGYLRLYNLFQFLPHAFFLTSSGVASHLYETLIPDEAVFLGQTPAGSHSSKDWIELKEVVNPSCTVLIDGWAAAGWPVPEAGYELMDQRGFVAATAEIAWEREKTAILREDELEYTEVFQKSGWSVFPLPLVLKDPAIVAMNPNRGA
jgi:DEAD/DEAH box helicase domain-containing protein